MPPAMKTTRRIWRSMLCHLNATCKGYLWVLTRPARHRRDRVGFETAACDRLRRARNAATQQRKTAPLSRRRVFRSAKRCLAVRAAAADRVATHAGRAGARHEGRAAAAGGVARHAGPAALRDLRGQAVGRHRRDRHRLRGGEAQALRRKRQRSESSWTFSPCVSPGPSVESNRGARWAESTAQAKSSRQTR